MRSLSSWFTTHSKESSQQEAVKSLDRAVVQPAQPPPVPTLNLGDLAAAPRAQAHAQSKSQSQSQSRSHKARQQSAPRASRHSTGTQQRHADTRMVYMATTVQAQQASVVMEGCMNKLKSRGMGIGKSWVPQHFVLKVDALYYTPNKAFSHKMKKISLLRTRVGTAQHYTKREYSFGVLDAKARELHIMCAESESLMHEWIKALIAVQAALESRMREVQPDALALNPCFPNIPSLPAPAKKQEEQADAGSVGKASPAAPSCITLVPHLTDSEEEEEEEGGMLRRRHEREADEGSRHAMHQVISNAAEEDEEDDDEVKTLPQAVRARRYEGAREERRTRAEEVAGAAFRSHLESDLRSSVVAAVVGGGGGEGEVSKGGAVRGVLVAAVPPPPPPPHAPLPHAASARGTRGGAGAVDEQAGEAEWEEEEEALEKLAMMGFGERERNVGLLRKHAGSIPAVVLELASY